MSFTRVTLGTVLVVASSAAAATGGCVSSNNAAPINGGDSAIPSEDTGAPPVGVDSSSPDVTPPPSDAGTDTTVTPTPDSGPAEAGADAADSAVAPDAADSAVPTASVRFANLTSTYGSSSLVPGADAPDICIAPHGTGAWQGPLLNGAGLKTGLAALSVSRYFTVPAGQNDVRLIAPGASSCVPADGQAPYDITNLPPVPVGGTFTIALIDAPPSDGGSTLPTVVALADETSTGAGVAKVRLVNVASQLPDAITFELGSGAAATTPFGNVPPTQMLDSNADTLGYQQVPAVASIDTTFVDLSTTYQTSAIALPAGALVTAFVTEDDTDGFSYDLVYCADGQTSPTSAALTNCTVYNTNNSPPAATYTRFANFIADTTHPAADVCIRYHGASTFNGPLIDPPKFDGTPQSLTPPGGPTVQSTLSGYFQVTGGFQYDVRFVAGKSQSCATGLGPDYLYAPSATGNATLAATGFLKLPGDAGEPGQFDAGIQDAGSDAPSSTPLPSVGISYAVFGDENFTTNTGAVRGINLAAWNPQPYDLVSPNWSFTEIPYGAFGTAPSFVDPYGYRAVPGTGGSLNVANTIGGSIVDSVSYSLAASQTATFFVFTYTTGAVTSLGVLECVDSLNTFGGIWTCSVLSGG